MSTIIKKQLVQAITIIVALIMIADFFFSAPELKTASGTLQTWVSIIANIALGLGALNLIRSNGKDLMKREPGKWPYSLWLLGLFVVLFILGVSSYVSSGDQNNNTTYLWFFNNVYVSLGETLYAITGFYIFSAAYRAFKAKTIDAALLLVSGILVMLTNAPVGEAIWSGFPQIGRWLLDFGQVPAMRTFMIVGAFGLLAYGIRTLLGKQASLTGAVE